MLCVLFAFAAHAEKSEQYIRPRFQKPIDGLQKMLSVSDDPEAVVLKLREGGRGFAFSLEGMIKLYEKDFEQLSPYRAQVKRLEDYLGWYIDTEDHLKLTKQLLDETQNPKVFAHLTALRDQAKQRLVTVLKADHWLGSNPLLKRLEKTLDDTEWHSREEDHKMLAKRLRQHIEDHLIEPDYDMKDLQSGLHKFRRELRWLLIYAQSLNGQVVLDDRDLPEKWREILKDPIATSSYSTLPPPEGGDWHLFFPRALYLELTKAVKQLGDAKDVGEAELEWLAEALQKGEAAPNRLDALKQANALVKKAPFYLDRRETAEAVEARIRGGSLLRRLAETFDKQRKWDKHDCQDFFRRCVPPVTSQK